MARTTQQQIDALDSLIEQIELYGQSISSDGQTLTQASLPALYHRLDMLTSRLQRESNGAVLINLPED